MDLFKPVYLTGLLFMALCLPVVISPALAQTSGEPVELTRDEDHARTMQLLGAEFKRDGANGSNPEADNYANYDEALASPYGEDVPDPLLTNGREPVTTPQMWWDVRRPEIEEFFDREIYGRQPDGVPDVAWEIVAEFDTVLYDIPVVTKHLLGHVDNASYPAISVDIMASVHTPADAAGEVPVIIQFGGVNFTRGEQTGGFGGFGGGNQGPGWQEQLLTKGWGYASLAPNSIQADNGAGLTQGIIGLVNKGQPRSLDDWGSLRAWGWGAGRLLDYFETDDDVDAEQVGITGHSRYGKAAAVTMAYDDRFAIGYISSSGAGGLSLYRRNYGELVENVAGTTEYHWMAGNFIKYASLLTWDDMPVDAHQLVTLIAPRPVYISSGESGDEWVDAKGMYLAGYHATPVYELLGATGLTSPEYPGLEVNVADGEVAFRQHSSGHTSGPNWPYFIEFADRYLDAP